ncbi:hypothetical protein [Robertmurraya sp.]|uniref:hypothetical protein n=1 Tax=Robertmurraya sp. TaxID=2837525 RepID=UPI00370384BB
MTLAPPPLKELPRPKPQRLNSPPVPPPSENFSLSQKHFIWLSLEKRGKKWFVKEKNGNPLIASDHPITALYKTVKKLLDFSPHSTIYYDHNCTQTIRYFEKALRKQKLNLSRRDYLYNQLMFLKDAPYRKKDKPKE